MVAVGEKIREGDPALTVGGEPLEEHLAEEEAAEKKNEVHQELGKDEAEKRKAKKKQKPKARYVEEGDVKVSKRTRRLTDREIREEYGLMSKPFKTKMENILWVIVNEGPILVPEIAAKIEAKPADVSGFLSRLHKRIGHDLIERKKIGTGFSYEARHSFSPEAGYRTFLERNDDGTKKTHKRRKAAIKASERERKPGDTKPRAELAAVPEVAQEIKEQVTNLAEALNGGLQVHVTGQIQILIGWIGRVDKSSGAML